MRDGPITRAHDAMPAKARISRISFVINRHAMDVNPFEVSTKWKTILHQIVHQTLRSNA
jgi:hypothetical protein